MTNFLTDFSGLETFFLACAVVGGFFVLVKLVLQFIGGDGVGDGGVDVGMEGSADHGDSDVGFRVLSLHGLSSFFMMFGLVGLALYRQSQAGVVISTIGAVVAGSISVWMIGKLFKGAAQLQSSGTLKTATAVGCTGTVYLNIPAAGTGRVSLNFHNRQRELDAMEKDGLAVATGTPVRVVRVNANVLIVEVIH